MATTVIPPALVAGAVDLLVTSWQREPNEQGGDADWQKRNWSATIYAATDIIAAAIRTAFKDGGTYRRSINGMLVGGPIITISGTLLGIPVLVGVEIGQDEYIYEDEETHYRMISVRFREE